MCIRDRPVCDTDKTIRRTDTCRPIGAVSCLDGQPGTANGGCGLQNGTRTAKPGHRNVAADSGSNSQVATGQAAVGANVAGAEERLHIRLAAKRLSLIHI